MLKNWFTTNLQVEIYPEDHELLTLNTHKDTYVHSSMYKTIIYGISRTSAIK